MKNRSLLYLLLVGSISAAPAFADRTSDASMEQRDNSITMRDLSVRDGGSGRDFGRGRFDEAGFMARWKGFSRHSKFSVESEALKPNRDEEIDDGNDLELGPIRGEQFERFDDENIGERDRPDAKRQDLSFSAIVAPEPETVTLLLLGVGVMGMLLYRRNSP